ncbi:hypothetical protein BMS3Bbin11_00045 [bacterium BMS3Bbin11]|nr:hypothetical protein BMS3Abin11_00421 [bacterium BMS3Abin11]GBE44966.1 hypothetical protein BMS3Bbin11_00045 [bacterium BMS3Bbin11]HDH09197.1 hypothetical protein [Gammaproteobacteria bacterium]HDH16191.1 hypothetical protein [Gammaproteobacteria bacterium]HDZ77910.1 hypothetical protein [Gammaproteobacteria bacterium]
MNHRTGIAFWLLFVPATAAAGTNIVIPPFVLNGELSYSVLQRDTERVNGHNESTLDQQLSFRINANTYVWKPWFGLLDGGLLLGLQDGKRSVAGFNSIGQSDQSDDTKIVNGNINFRLFPKSTFPFEAFFIHSDTRTESLTNRGSDNITSSITYLNDLTTTRYGARQFYNSDKGFRMKARAEKIEVQNAQEIDTGKFLLFEAGVNYHDNKLDFRLSYDQFDRGRQNDDGDILFSELLHHYTSRKKNNFSIRNELTYENRTTTRLAGITNDRDLFQYNNFTNWTLNSARLTRFTANGQLQRGLVNSGNEEKVTSDSVSANFGAVHNLTPVLQITGGLGGNASNRTGIQSDDDTRKRLYESVGIRYFPYAIPLGKYRYNWSGSASARSEQATFGNSITLSAGLGHNINRQYRFGRQSMLTLSGSQALNPLHRKGADALDDRVEILLNQQLALRLNRSQGGSNFYTSLTLSDSRDLGDDDNNYQSLNLQFSGSLRISRFSSLSGSATWQATRFESNLKNELVNKQRTDNTNLSANIEYKHRRAFKVNGLRFRSKLVLMNRKADYKDDNLDRLISDQRFVKNTWENRLEYRIGLLDLKLIGRLSGFDQDTQTSVLFQISRYFVGII